jgi:hypothetical protein
MFSAVGNLLVDGLQETKTKLDMSKMKFEFVVSRADDGTKGDGRIDGGPAIRDDDLEVAIGVNVRSVG